MDSTFSESFCRCQGRSPCQTHCCDPPKNGTWNLMELQLRMVDFHTLVIIIGLNLPGVSVVCHNPHLVFGNISMESCVGTTDSWQDLLGEDHSEPKFVDGTSASAPPLQQRRCESTGCGASQNGAPSQPVSSRREVQTLPWPCQQGQKPSCLHR